jgi:hypothetical protein
MSLCLVCSKFRRLRIADAVSKADPVCGYVSNVIPEHRCSRAERERNNQFSQAQATCREFARTFGRNVGEGCANFTNSRAKPRSTKSDLFRKPTYLKQCFRGMLFANPIAV